MLGRAEWTTEESLTEVDGFWRKTLGDFFSVQTGPFRVRQRHYGSYRAISDDSTYDHRNDQNDGGVYHEYDVEENAPGRAPGLLRVWDFSRASTKFQSEDGRREIAGREREVISYLKDRNPDFETAVLQPRDADDPNSAIYWEVFERRRQLIRLRDANLQAPDAIDDAARVELARGVLQRVKSLHDIDATHLDLGAHSVWFEPPSSVRLSHLFAASYPTLHSLAENRYQFLTAGWKLPEDYFGDQSDHKRRDVFLLGTVVHQILFGKPPNSASRDTPPEWDEHVDSSDRFASLHDWLHRALSWDVKDRFIDAAKALEQFNASAEDRLAGPRLLLRLDRFRRWRDQLELLDAFPNHGTLKRSDRVIVWNSVRDGADVVVKLWKRSCWDDDRRETPRIISFLERAEELSRAQPDGTARIFEAAFTGDALVLIQEMVKGVSLDKDLTDNAGYWLEPEKALAFIDQLTATVSRLHESRVTHGDIKPSNIMVLRTDSDSSTPVLIDLLDFTSKSEGDIVTTAYSPTTGGRFERDRFATTVIVEEILARASVDRDVRLRLMNALDICRAGPPENATLLPLADALDKELRPHVVDEPVIRVTIQRGATGPMLSDEGLYGVRLNRSGAVVVRGAAEELELLAVGDHLTNARRRPIDHGKIARTARHEHFTFQGELIISVGTDQNCSELDFIIGRLRGATSTGSVAYDETEAAEGPDDDRAADEIIESSYGIEDGEPTIDVPVLWRTLIDVERELFTEGTADGASVYNQARKRHLIPFNLQRGSFEFARHDRVIVERASRGGGWSELGLLDVEASVPDAIVLDASARSGNSSGTGPLVRDDDRLRLRSLLETFSHSRRETATTRILTRQSVIPNLVEFFKSDCPESIATAGTHNASEIRQQYDLNNDQAAAFCALLDGGPIGLLQGPPGTGKTKFIASIVHYALANGLVRNVLLSSQSHEAVNNAAEAVMRLFRRGGEAPRIVRVGQQGAVSSALRPFHSDSIEAQYKDRFRAELRERLKPIGERLLLNADLVDKLIYADVVIRPVLDRFRDLSAEAETEPHRLEGLRRTLDSICAKVGYLSVNETAFVVDDAFNSIIDVITRGLDIGRDRVSRFLAVTKLARDWIGSISTRQRSFETFLAGTRNIVAGTCVGLGRSALGLTQTRFDLVVIDEAARCTASELAVPMQAGCKIILVGDHIQLEPHHRPDVVEVVTRQTEIPRREILRSDFERIFQSRYGSAAGHTLTEQYRMLPAIGRIVSKAFYGNALRHGRKDGVIPPDVLPPSLSLPLLWLSTDALARRGFQHASRDSRSLINESESDAIIALLREFDSHGPFMAWLQAQTRFQEPIGIICTYAAQRDLIRRRFPAAGLTPLLRQKCKIDTVDSYQGKENPIVLLSLVRNNEDGPVEVGGVTIRDGFMSRANRINVALSRAMDRLVLVGSMRGWRKDSPMGAVAEAFLTEQHAGFAKVVEIDRDVALTASPRPRRRRLKVKS